MGKGVPVPPVSRGYHGNARDVAGGVIEPNARGHKAVFEGLSDSQSTYFTPKHGDSTDIQNENNGWRWASSAADVYRSGDPLIKPTPVRGRKDWQQTAVPGRPRVHITEPDPEQHIDKNIHGMAQPDNNLLKHGERVTPRQKVIDTMWAPPPQNDQFAQSHVEQTLPHINWRQFGGENWKVHSSGTNANGPWKEISDDSGRNIEESGNRWGYTRADSSPQFAKVVNPSSEGAQLKGQQKFPGT